MNKTTSKKDWDGACNIESGVSEVEYAKYDEQNFFKYNPKAPF